MNTGIYLITNIANTKEYVGSSKNLKRRKYQHWCNLGHHKHTNPYLQSSWNKHSSQSFRFEVLEYCELKDLVEREKWWIALLGTKTPKGYNICDPENGRYGIPVSVETRVKLSTANKGRKYPPYTPERRAKIGAANRGRKHSLEARANMSDSKKGKPSPMLGKILTPETKAKLSAANIGKTFTPERRAKMSIAQKLRRAKSKQTQVSTP